jgi:hypothetical protein
MVELSGFSGQVVPREAPPRAGDVPRHAGDPARLYGLGFAHRHLLDESLRDLLAYCREVAGAAGGASAPARHETTSRGRGQSPC